MNREPGGATALVLGGSIAGLMSARVLSDFVERVIVVEPDQLSSDAEHRKGVPQAHHIHGVLHRGQDLLEQYFHGFVAEAQSRGAPLLVAPRDFRKLHRYGWALRFESELRVLGISRPLLEAIVRGRVFDIENVDFRLGRRAASLEFTASSERVAGAWVQDAAGELEFIAAELIVDATGRNSLGPRWLEDAGYVPPAETHVDGQWSYSTIWVQMPPDWDPGYQALSVLPMGEAVSGARRHRGAAMLRQDGDRRWVFTAFGAAGERPPADLDALTEYLKSLAYPEVDDALKALKTLNEPKVWRTTANRLRSYDTMTRRPDGLLFMGDSVAAFNPVYGQGMTVAILGAHALAAELTEVGVDDPALATRFQQRLARELQFPWTLATNADLRMIRSSTGHPDGNEAFMDRVEALSSEDPSICLRLLETAHLVRDPSWLRSDEELRERIDGDWARLGALVGQ